MSDVACCMLLLYNIIILTNSKQATRRQTTTSKQTTRKGIHDVDYLRDTLPRRRRYPPTPRGMFITFHSIIIFLSTFLSVCGDLLCLALDLESQSVEALLFGNSKTFAMARNTSRPPSRLVFRNSNIYNSKSSITPLQHHVIFFLVC